MAKALGFLASLPKISPGLNDARAYLKIMLWFVLIFTVVVTAVTGLITRSLRRALRAGLITFILGAALALIVVYSGFMGG